MGKPLQSEFKSRHILFVISLLILMMSGIELRAQVALSEIQPYEIEITDRQPMIGNHFWRINPTVSSDEGIIAFTPSGEISLDEVRSGFYLYSEGEESGIAFRTGENQETGRITLEIVNQTGRLIDELQLLFDLSFKLEGEPLALKLRYFIDREFQEGFDKDLFQTGTISAPPENWQTASISHVLDELLLDDGETLYLEIEWEGTANNGLSDVVAFKRLRITPQEREQTRQFSVGDIVITEILPDLSKSDGSLQYLEFYNTSHQEINLRGLKIRLNDREYMIRKSLKLSAYEMIVVANRHSDEFGFTADYLIPSLEIPSHGGMIEIIDGDNQILRVAYDERQGNAAWELRHVSTAFEGYLSINDFRVSGNELNSDLTGSPGTSGSTARSFTHQLDQPDRWHLLASPGILNRELSLRAELSVPDERAGNENILPGTAFFAQSESSGFNTHRLVTDEPLQTDEYSVTFTEREDGLQLIGNPFTEPISFNQISAVNGSLESRIGQFWNPDRKSFQLTSVSNQMLSPWQGMVVKNRDADRVTIQRRNDAESQQVSGDEDQRNRYIWFKMSGTTPDGEIFHDDATVLYFHARQENERFTYESEKLWPVFSRTEQPEAGMLYFIETNTREGNRYLAQISRDYMPDAPVETRMGHLSYNISGNFEIEWNEMYNIPDEWSLILIDHFAGTTIDMKEQTSYRFESTQSRTEEIEFPENPDIMPVTGLDPENRFTVRLDPNPLRYPMEQESEKPETVELYQNYPNPFNPVTNIRFFLPEQNNVTVGIYNVVGQRVGLLLEDVLQQGEHTVSWDATDMPSGIYIVQLEYGNRVLTRKMTLIK